MKRVFTIIFVSLLLGYSYNSHAQVGVGGKLGFTLNTMFGDGDVSDTKKIKAGLLFGGLANIYVSDRLAFQPELMIYQKGVSYFVKGRGYNSDYTFRLNLSYIEIPLLLQIKIGSNKVRGFVNIGPSIGFLAGGRASTITSYGKKNSVSLNEFFDGYLNRIDIGLALSGGVAIKLGPGDLIAEPRFIVGLIDIDRNSSVAMRNFSVGISTGYVYYFGQ